MIRVVESNSFVDAEFPIRAVTDWEVISNRIELGLLEKFQNVTVKLHTQNNEEDNATLDITCDNISCRFYARCYINSRGYGIIELRPDRNSYTGNPRDIPYETYGASTASKLVDKISYIFKNI